MNIISIPYDGHHLMLVDHDGEPWSPILPLCRAMKADYHKLSEWTLGKRCFSAKVLSIPLIDRVCEFVCIPLRKLFGWLAHAVNGDHLHGVDDLLHEAWVKARPHRLPVTGRVMLTLRDGHVDVAQHVPDDWLVAPLEGFHHLSTKAGYRVTADVLHDMLYESRV